VTDNVVAATIPRGTNNTYTPTMVWRAANGRVIKLFQGAAPR
jgi:hypothetical protein